MRARRRAAALADACPALCGERDHHGLYAWQRANRLLSAVPNRLPLRGMVLKNERLADAFARLVKNETSHAASLDDARLIGVFEHFYDTNRSGNGGYGTHYVVLGYVLKWENAAALKPDDQHSELTWWPVAALLASDRVHENTKAYFRPARTPMQSGGR